MGIPEQGRLTKEHMFPKWTYVQEQVAYLTQGSSRFSKFWSKKRKDGQTEAEAPSVGKCVQVSLGTAGM